MTPITCLGPLEGFVVGITADRRWEEQAELLRRRGATVVHGPCMDTQYLADDDDLRRATVDVIEQPARRGGGHHRHRRAGVAGDGRGVGHGPRPDGRPGPGPHPGPGPQGGGRRAGRGPAGVGPVGDRADGRRAGQAAGRRGRRPTGGPPGVRDGEPRVHRRPGGGGGDGGAGARLPVALPGRHPARPHPGRRRPQRPGRRHHLHQRPRGAQPVHDRGRAAGRRRPPAGLQPRPHRRLRGPGVRPGGPATRASTSPSSPRSAGWACWCGP